VYTFCIRYLPVTLFEPALIGPVAIFARK
jgi:hypothetical protein